MTLWGANDTMMRIINTPMMSFITPFSVVCTVHFLQCSFSFATPSSPTASVLLPHILQYHAAFGRSLKQAITEKPLATNSDVLHINSTNTAVIQCINTAGFHCVCM